ncbi:MAG TPA: PepSY domain-containing protein [Anaerolineaceae bacterium]|nr:PepSY domain-containing protein [Anaerolineaceae bacterium]
MYRNRIVLLSLVLLLAVTSFGFTGRPNAMVISIDRPLICPHGYHLVHGTGIFSWTCVQNTSNNDTPFIQNNLATVKVSPELAAALALFGQPAGTVVTNVSGLYTGTIPPYYEVTIVDGNYVKTVYIDARNGNILPPQYNHPIYSILGIY